MDTSDTKYRIYRSLTVIFLLTHVISGLSAQDIFSRLEHLTVNDGLLSNRVRCILRDSRDYLWIGTDAGLNRFDSYQVLDYVHDKNKPASISSNTVTCIYEDRAGNLWFGTDDGLNLFDRDKNSFITYRNDSLNSASLDNNYISSITEDKNGTLWIVTDGSCLNKWLPQSETFVRYPYQGGRRMPYSIPARMVATDSKGFLWVLSIGPGIFRFNPETGKFDRFTDPEFNLGENNYKSLFIDENDKIWISSTGSGFFSFNPATGIYEKFISDGKGKGPNQTIIIDAVPDGEDHLLLAADQGGVNRYNKKTGDFEYFRYDPKNSEGLNNDGIMCLYRDREGILWIGTSGGGVNYFNPGRNRFKLFNHNEGNPNSLVYDLASVFLEDSRGLIWIGTDGGGVSVYDPHSGNFTNYKHDSADPYSISGSTIRNIAEDSDGDIWIGTWDGGLCRYNPKTNKFSRVQIKGVDPRNNVIINLFIDHNDQVWITMLNEGLIKYDKQKGIIERYNSDPGIPESISTNIINGSFEDSEKNLWFYSQEGLNLYNRSSNTFRVFKFPDNIIWAFYRDNNGNLWVGTSSGLYYCKPDGTIIKTYNSENGLPDNFIKGIVADNDGNIWISSNHGISRLNPLTGQIRNYSKGDGLQGDQFLQQAVLKTRDGELYFGGINGFNSFNPRELKDNELLPQVHITDFQIFNKPVKYGHEGSQFQTYIEEAKEITLNWHQSVFSFSFAAINYTNPLQCNYAYTMEGFETDWNYTDALRRYVMYTNLSPGKYVFRVKASNNDGKWNESGVSLNIIVLPPWWKTVWFRISVSLAILIILAAIYLSRVIQLKKQKIRLEKLVALKTSELKEKNAALQERQAEIEAQKEDLSQLNNSKDKFFSIIAHDLRSPFNSILGLSRMMKEEISEGNFKNADLFARLINETSEKTFKLLENLLEWANIQRGQKVFKPEKFDLCEVVDEELGLLSEIAKTKNIELLRSGSGELRIFADKNMIRSILRNLITNAVKFTNRNGRVVVDTISGKNDVEVSVTDNGIGITKDKITDLFLIDTKYSTKGTENEEGTGLGLYLCKEFVEKHEGRIWVQSEPGRGSSFRFLLPLNN